MLSLLVFLVSVSNVAKADQQQETVILLHGIGQSSLSMLSVETKLEDKGYKVLSINYPSTDKDIEDIADFLHEKHLTKEFWKNAKKVHFVTHSMGGLVTRYYLDKYKQDKVGKVVMLAPPNGGSEISDLLHDYKAYKMFYGPAGEDLTTSNQQKKKTDVYYDLGIIAGKKEWPYVVAAFVLPGESDGRVSVENTRLDGMTDHIIIPATHSFIMFKPNVHKQIIHFLENGEFKHEE